MTRHLISRWHQIVVLVIFSLTLATAVVLVSPHNDLATAPASSGVLVVDGWGDPTGG